MEAIDVMRNLFPNCPISAPDYDPAVFARMKADSYNRSTGKYTEVDCPECRNRGLIAFVREDLKVGYRECGCMHLRRCVNQMEKSGVSRELLQRSTFERFHTQKPWQRDARSRAEAYAADPRGWFAACGQSGSGKTHLCLAVCRALLYRPEEVRYFSWRSEVTRLKQAEDRQQQMDRWCRCGTLYIDDLFKSGAGPEGRVMPTSADISIAYEILNSRYQSGLRTILSTELLPEELYAIDEATAGRILEMAGENLLTIDRDTKKNHRLSGVVPG